MLAMQGSLLLSFLAVFPEWRSDMRASSASHVQNGFPPHHDDPLSRYSASFASAYHGWLGTGGD
mgnify:CR=1 FL=1